ncbi:hypothetical protein BDP81DRAFT_423500 [Colletotrichum phormii]|uniref:Uncharacterized protein n=1 Tax=Colletotrichum phormii TaxID=359342 RepID=A0AAI9ZVS8_9PEZI|nr:uncharacterized protein BDP81DRAFT_423500 [Colletotrichum phormii]KAK1639124.1 hypothetical protein BDP81DRAFT_423500 [Colletotrichum phormii]
MGGSFRVFTLLMTEVTLLTLSKSSSPSKKPENLLSQKRQMSETQSPCGVIVRARMSLNARVNKLACGCVNGGQKKAASQRRGEVRKEEKKAIRLSAELKQPPRSTCSPIPFPVLQIKAVIAFGGLVSL